jgi:DNA-binding beta-propeller fold protein YncE
VISGRTNTVVATIPVGTDPFGVAANPRTNTIYVANDLDNTVSVLTSCHG